MSQRAKCPKCGCVANPPDATECMHCGIIFSRYQEVKNKQLLMTCKVCQKEISKNAASCPHCGEIYSGEFSNQHRSKEIKFHSGYAGFWFRAIAIIIDGIIAQIASIIIVFPLAFALGASMSMLGRFTAADIEGAGYLLGYVLGIVIQWLYFTISESSKWQATLGKKMFGILVTDMDGNRIGFGKANGRYWSKIISALILFVGFIMAAFTQRKQGLHDIIAGTLVIRK